jgi:3-methyladenine DNA glycosylase AlkD
MTKTEIDDFLEENKDEKYRDFQCSLMPGTDKNTVAGVRVPALRDFVKAHKNDPDTDAFLNTLPHGYHEENVMHALLINGLSSFDGTVMRLDAFLPFVCNWAVCDIISPKAFRSEKDKLYANIVRWLKAGDTYTVRFALKMLMDNFLGDDFSTSQLTLAASACCDDYYINMMCAWYFATALAKQYENALPFIENRKLSPWVHAKTVQKACESFRVTEEHKEYLKTLK